MTILEFMKSYLVIKEQLEKLFLPIIIIGTFVLIYIGAFTHVGKFIHERHIIVFSLFVFEIFIAWLILAQGTFSKTLLVDSSRRHKNVKPDVFATLSTSSLLLGSTLIAISSRTLVAYSYAWRKPSIILVG